jgi:hypothetical protein
MSDLFTYLKQTQRFLKDQRQFAENPANLLEYVNRARREVAGATMCVRRLTPISGSIQNAQVLLGGNNYSPATLIVITPPDFPSGQLPYPSGLQALAQPIINSGVIKNVDITNAGGGYFQPIATIVDPAGTGSGAQVSLTTTPINVLQINQEVYPFSAINVSMFPGVDSVYMIKSVSVIYANYRYSLPMYSFSTYQAMIRQYPFQYTYVPTFCSQYGQGANGSFFAYPWPSQTYQWEFDCFCLPQDLTIDNRSTDVIPAPWDDVVPYFAAHLAYLEQQNFNAARYYLDLFDKMTLRKSGYARPGRVTNPYGRW